MSYLYILEIKPLLVTSFEDIFSQSIDFLFVLYGFLCSVEDFAGGSDSKVSAYNVGDQVSILESGRSPGEGNSHPLQYPCLENPMDGGTW